jgi:ribonuclease HI
LTATSKPEFALVHADESCLGNGMEGENPGGASSLVELKMAESIVRSDAYISAPATTNNRMALSGALATLALLAEHYGRLRIVYVSDSQYLVKGMTEWVSAWRTRGWRRKGGKIENLELWKRLVKVAEKHVCTWKWVRGHAGHAKNEYANDLAIRAATEQTISDGLVESGFQDWLAQKRARGQFAEYDADKSVAEIAEELALIS